MRLSNRHVTPPRTASQDFRHDAEYVIAEVLNGGFEQLWGNFHGKRGYSVPQMIERAADYFESLGAAEIAAVLKEAEAVTFDPDDQSEYDRRERDEEGDSDDEEDGVLAQLDVLDSKLAALWPAGTWEKYFPEAGPTDAPHE